MQYKFLEILRCPVSKAKLRFELISEFTKAYGDSGNKRRPLVF